MEAELALISKVELRIALAGTDDKLESALALYLAPLLLKLASPHSQVRSQILKLIQHLLIRVNAATTIKLPIDKLLDQVKAPVVPAGADTTNVRLFSLVFVTKGVDRIKKQEKVELIPKVLTGISEYPTNIQARLFYIFRKLISEFKESDPIDLTLNEMDRIFLTQSITKLFLFEPVTNDDGTHKIPENYSCAGLTNRDCQFLTTFAGITLDSAQLSAQKAPLLNFLSRLDGEDKFLPLIVASADSSTAVADKAISIFKKFTVDYENTKLVESFIQLLIGDIGAGRPPAKPVLQEKILSQILNRSKVATRSSHVSTISSRGLEASYGRLKSSTIQFIQWVTQNLTSVGDGMETDEEETFNINIAAQLKENLTTESWDSSAGINYHNYITQRRNQIQALGVILKRDPKLLNGLSYIKFLFELLSSDLSELRSTIQDALSGLTVHLPFLSEEDKNSLKTTLSDYLVDDLIIKTSSDSQKIEGLFALRYIAIKFINCTFPFEDFEARLLCILGTSTNNRSNIIEEASKGLHPHWFNILQSSNTLEFKSTPELLGQANEIKFPSFENIVQGLKLLIDSSEQKKFPALQSCMSTATNFAVQCLVMQSIEGHKTVVVSDQEWAIRLDKALELDKTVLKLVTRELAKIANSGKVLVENFEANLEMNSVDLLLWIILREFLGQDAHGTKVSVNKGESKVEFGKLFIRILSLSSRASVSTLTSYLQDLLHLLTDNSNSISDNLTTYLAQSIGIIATHPSVLDHDLVAYVSKLTNLIGSGHKNSILLALGYIISRLTLRGRESALSTKTYKLVFDELLCGIKSSETRLLNISMEAISQLCLFGSLGPELQLVDDVESYRSQIVENLEAKVQKCNERAVVTWSHLSLTYPEQTDIVVDAFSNFESVVYETHISKQVEYLFTSGEALATISGGWNSEVLSRLIDIPKEDIKIQLSYRNSRVSFILDKVLKACTNTKPSLRKAGCIWLLSLVQFLPHLDAIISRAPEIHICFMRFLADRDELVQESASRGLSLVYEMGNSELKDTLVRGLLKSFTDSSSAKTLTAGTVTEDTTLFEPGVLKTDDGSVSTYKDILNLASEVGDPSLVYKFMSLARHSALWSSRKGIAFGLGSILSKSSLEDLLASDESLSKRLIPKLFRYRFDPSPSVSKSMNDIWNTLISDTSKTVSSNLDSIFDELLKGIGNKEWRVRQASTAALTDLIQSLAFDRYESRLEEIWSMSLRSVDDIKDSVRKEGNKLSRSLASILVRSINVESGSSLVKANSVLTKLIPTLLGTKGLLNDVEDIRNFALETILNLCKKSGVAIKPFIPELIGQLITLMSTLEPQMINYLSLNADKYNMKVSDIDAKRLQSIGHSPMMDAIERLLDLADDETMKDLVPALQSSIRGSVGLPSKAAGSRVLVTLVVRHLHMVKPFGDQLLKSSQQQLKDKNETISASYATTAGYLCRVSSIEAVLKFSKYLRKLYFESESEQLRKIAGIACEAVSKYSGDRFSTVATAFLPFAFVAKSDPEPSVKDSFGSVWSDNTAGNGAIKLYIQEISTLVNNNLNSQQYLIRQVCAKSIADACNKMDNGANGIGTTANQLFEVLINACKGRSWSGKEDVVDALVSLSVKSKYFLLNDDDERLLDKINSVLLLEAKRNNKEYKRHAVKSLGRFVKEFDDLVDDYVEIMTELVEEDDEEDDDDDHDAKEVEIKKMKLDNLKATRKHLKREEEKLSLMADIVDSFTVDEENRSYKENLLSLVFKSMIDLLDSDKIAVTWRSQVAISKHLNSVCGLISSIDVEIDAANADKLKAIYTKLYEILDYTIENAVIQFIRCTKQVITSNPDTSFNEIVISNIKQIYDRKISSVVKFELEAVLKKFG